MKKTKTPKKKTVRKTLVKKLDKLVSEYVRLRDKKCVTCGSTARLGAGHLFTRQSYSTRWDLLNVHAQCWPCNYRHEFDFYPFQRWFVERYGQDEYDDLHKRFRTVSKITNADLMSIADTLEKIIEQMHGELSAN